MHFSATPRVAGVAQGCQASTSSVFAIAATPPPLFEKLSYIFCTRGRAVKSNLMGIGVAGVPLYERNDI